MFEEGHGNEGAVGDRCAGGERMDSWHPNGRRQDSLGPRLIEHDD